jgi:sulfonate transport system permease protein
MVVHEIEHVELLPTYSSLVEETAFLLRARILLQAMAVSAARMLAGFVLGAVIGLALGLLMGPALALLPLYVLWFGFGEVPKVLLIATAVGIVSLQGAWEGARSIPRAYLEAAEGLGATRGLVLRRIVLPAALPRIISGLRIAIMLAWVTLVVAELIQPTMPSLGYLLALAGAYPRVPTIVVALAAIAALVFLFDSLALAAYRGATRWMERRHA